MHPSSELQLWRWVVVMGWILGFRDTLMLLRFTYQRYDIVGPTHLVTTAAHECDGVDIYVVGCCIYS